MTSTLHGVDKLLSWGFTHEYGDLITNSNLGCLFCKLLLVKFGRKQFIFATCQFQLSEYRRNFLSPLFGEYSEEERLEVYRTKYSLLSKDDFKNRMKLQFFRNKERTSWIEVFLGFYAPEGDPAAAFLPVKAAHNYDSESLLIHRTNQQLEKCRDRHKECSRATEGFLPTRLIKVGGESDMPVLRVSQPQEKGCYLALSYCWGGPQELTTTTVSLQSRINGLPLRSLPKTIRDAITLTRLLRFEYLWVDALCIIQDSSADKIAEINAMGSVYKNATLTIAAANSPNVKDGFLIQAPPQYHCQLPFILPNAKMGSMYCVSDIYDSGVSNPLDFRGWTYQEDLLSQRILYFGHGGLSWKCQSERRELTSDEVTPLGTRLPSKFFMGVDPSLASPTSPLQEVWQGIVHDYSGRVLTFPEDRLPALAGIAGEFQKVLNPETTYFGGLWECWLIRHLGWYNSTHLIAVRNRDMSVRDDNQRQKPTWSWMSINARVSFDEIRDENATYISCATDLVDQDAPLGQLTGGSLTLRGTLVSALSNVLAMFPKAAEIRMDNLKDRFNDAMLCLYLGNTATRIPIGLILQPTKDGNFIRVGQIRVQKARKELVWPNHLKPQTVTIV